VNHHFIHILAKLFLPDPSEAVLKHRIFFVKSTKKNLQHQNKAEKMLAKKERLEYLVSAPPESFARVGPFLAQERNRVLATSTFEHGVGRRQIERA
jgi:hypothetical protein